jgi:rRNA processing protein Krr1/Pno1
MQRDEQMFKEETLFILGAGASFPYGYPLGKKLIEDIIHNIKHDEIYIPMSEAHLIEHISNASSHIAINFKLSELLEILESTQIDTFDQVGTPTLNTLTTFKGKNYAKIQIRRIEEFHELQNALTEFDPVSIDAFLSHHDKYSLAGKIMIIYALLKCENKRYFSMRKKNEKDTTNEPEPDNWYSYLINDILSGCNLPEDICKNKINIITFNYDVSLDYCLQEKLSNVGLLKKNPKAQEYIRTLTSSKIKHVYGKIYNDDPTETYSKFYPKSNSVTEIKAEILNNSRRFLKAINEKKLIKLISPERKTEDPYKKLILEAKMIYIIGFGFDRDNLNILGLSDKESEWGELFNANGDRKLSYMDYDDKMKALSEQINFLKAKYGSRITKSTSKHITNAYQNDFKISIYL